MNRNGTKWYKDEILFLINNFENKTQAELLNHINSNRNSKIGITTLRLKLYELGLRRFEKNKKWSDVEEKFLRNNYKNVGNKEIAKRLNEFEKTTRNFSNKHIEKKIRLLKLKRSKSDLMRIKSNHKERGAYKHFKTADKKRYEEGKIVIRNHNGRRYKYIKNEGKMIPLHRYLYEKYIKPIPKGHKIYFKDGNPLNCTLSNLVCKKATGVKYRLKEKALVKREKPWFVTI